MADAQHVRDPRALRALAHPLRLSLLSVLRVEGPATATALGRRLGESSGATSYHLRVLAEHGFVEDDAGRGTARERWWRATHASTEWQPDDVGEDVADELHRRLLDTRARLHRAWLADRAELGPEWSRAGGLNDHTVRVTPEQAERLTDELLAVLDRWAAEHPAGRPAEGSELVSVVVDVLPLKAWPL